MATNNGDAEAAAPSDPASQNDEHNPGTHGPTDSGTTNVENPIKIEDGAQETEVKLRDILSTSTTGQKRKPVGSHASSPSTKRTKAQKVVIKLKGNKSSGQDMVQAMLGKGPVQSKASGQGNPSTSEKEDKKVLKADTAALATAKRIFGDKAKCAGKDTDETNEMFKVTGMKTTLRDYQLVGAAFMLRHERAIMEPHGGIIADEMGVGKTVQAIACIIAHPSPSTSGPTLIVVPSQALVQQWIGEFHKHIDEGVVGTYEILQYRGKSHMSVRLLKACDFIFTTFSQVLQSYNSMGSLFDMEFHRIILDEADRIKTKGAGTSIACANLKGKHKWALSGTPIPNRLDEIMPYFRFIGINIKEDRNKFEQRFGKMSNDTTDDRIMAVLDSRMIRREKGMDFMRRQICKLPDCHQSVMRIRMTNEEFHIYSCIEGYIGKALNKDPVEGQAPKLEWNFHQLNGLRQAVDHPINLYPILMGMPSEDVKDLKEHIAKIEGKTGVYEQIYEQVEAYGTKKPGESSVDDSKSQDSQSEETRSLRSDSYVEMSGHLEYVLKSKENEGCIACFGKLTASNINVLECKHIVCTDCYNGLIEQCEATGRHSAKCPECGKSYFQLKESNSDMSGDGFTNLEVDPSVLDEINGDREDGYIVTGMGRKIKGQALKSKKRPCLGDDINGFQPTSSSSAQKWLNLCDKRPHKPVVPSAKTTAALDLILDWQRDAPNDKIIVFVEWTITANVLGRMLQEKRIPFIYYFGELDPKHREKALKAFEENEKIKVMIMGIKCGNLGLNITCANRAICLSLWWNYSNEEQARGRICRHGQTKETYFVRIVVEDSIDDRMLQLQGLKIQDIEPAMVSGKSEKLLTEQEVRWLFGQL